MNLEMNNDYFTFINQIIVLNTNISSMIKTTKQQLKGNNSILSGFYLMLQRTFTLTTILIFLSKIS